MHKGLSLLLLLLGLLFSSSSSSAAATVPQRRCFNLTPYEPILNGVIDAIPGRLIQDLLPVPLILADGGEVWSTTINILICKLDLILDQVSVQVLNTNFEKINLEVINKESIFMTIPFGVQMTARFQGDCGLYKPKVVSQIEFAATISANTDVCIDILGISDPANILNYTYATVSDIGYKADAQGFFWCIYDALPLLRSIIDKILEDNIDKIWAAVDKLITEALLPAAEKVLNGVLRAIGIQPYNATANALDEEVFAPMRKIHTKFEDKIRVINTGNFSQLLYNDKGTDAWMDGAYYRPSTVQSGFYPLGDYAQRDYNIPNGIVQMVMDDGGLLVSKPTGYERVWTDKGSGADMDGSFWRPIPPAGFLALGHVAQKGYDQPSVDVVRVVKEECVVRCDPWLTWTDRCSGADGDVSIWTVAETTSPTPGTFISMSNYNRPDDSAVLCLNPDCVELV